MLYFERTAGALDRNHYPAPFMAAQGSGLAYGCTDWFASTPSGLVSWHVAHGDKPAVLPADPEVALMNLQDEILARIQAAVTWDRAAKVSDFRIMVADNG